MDNTVIQPDIAGVGLGLRSNHYQEIFEIQPDVPWFELLSDNYMAAGGLPIQRAEQIRKNYPITLHGVGMSLGSADPLNMEYLKRLKHLSERLQPTFVSDHIAWVSVVGQYTHDLLPLPYTQNMLKHLNSRIQYVQDYLGRTILIENPSSYLTFTTSDMPEAEFIKQLCVSSGCELLLDVNNIYVSAQNHGFDAAEYLAALPIDKVKEIHLAGYEEMPGYLFDTHGYPVREPVWELYKKALKRFGNVPTLIEWDTDVPDFSTLLNEAKKAEQLMRARL
ncbi:MAG: hypothetical protein ACI910_001888 [Oleispira sp.]|jgi:uncharacterized protein (UPF0276 family)